MQISRNDIKWIIKKKTTKRLLKNKNDNGTIYHKLIKDIFDWICGIINASNMAKKLMIINSVIIYVIQDNTDNIL